MKWAECIRMNGRWTKSQRLTRFLTVLCNAFATLYAVAASEFDFTDEPYDLIIRLSSQKLTGMRRPYWPTRARHYRVAVMTRFEQALSTPGVRPAHSQLKHRETTSGRFDRQSADGEAKSDFAEGFSLPLLIAGLSVNDFNECLPGKHSLKSLTTTAPFARWCVERLDSAVSDVNEINVCGHGPHTLISLTPSLAARTEKMAASQRKFDRFRIPPVMQMERDIACIQ